jgi:ribosomal 30S subunit maturation factor RimM
VSGIEKVNRIIGVIGKPHGIKGYSYVRLITDYPDTICKEDILYLDEPCTKKLKIEDIKNVIYKGQSRLIFKFYGTEDNISAESLRDCNLYRDSESQPGLDKDSHWVDELVGCSVFLQSSTTADNKIKNITAIDSKSKISIEEDDESKSRVASDNKSKSINNAGCIGIVEEVKSCAYNDNLVIAAPYKKTIIIPMYEEYIERIDIRAKKIFLKSLPEYI